MNRRLPGGDPAVATATRPGYHPVFEKHRPAADGACVDRIVDRIEQFEGALDAALEVRRPPAGGKTGRRAPGIIEEGS